MKRTFVMLMGPGMIGKSTAARAVCKDNPEIALLTNDELMHKLFALGRQDVNMPINEMEKWRTSVNQNADCDNLIRLLHRDFISCNSSRSVVLAEGYAYMKEWYRQHVFSGLGQLSGGFDFWILKYTPPLEEQKRRRQSKYVQFGWSAEPEFHEQELLKAWSNYEGPTTNTAELHEVNDSTLAEMIIKIKQSSQG